MSGIFSKPKTPKILSQPEPEAVEDVEMVEEDAEEARKKEKKKLQAGGKRSTILSGIAAVLKKRLGE